MPLAPAAASDIGGPSTQELAGLRLLYQYSTGRKYEQSFAPETLNFLAHADPHASPGTRFDIIGLRVSALMPRGIEFFDIAAIESLHWATP